MARGVYIRTEEIRIKNRDTNLGKVPTEETRNKISKSNKGKNIKDLKGKKFYKLTVVDFSYQGRNGLSYWKCFCDCGKETIILGVNLSNGNTKSCGCNKKGVNKGHANGMWKEDVKYKPLHAWVRNNLFKPAFCQDCNIVLPYDVANISGLYLRDLADWEWLCRKCHMLKDGRLEKLIRRNKQRKEVLYG